jgi:hypothetical protein
MTIVLGYHHLILLQTITIILGVEIAKQQVRAYLVQTIGIAIW